MADQWLSIVEYARTFAVSDMTVRRRIKTGRLKAVLRDGKYYIPIGANGEVLDFSEVLDIEAPLKTDLLPLADKAPEPVIRAADPIIRMASPIARAAPQSLEQDVRNGASFRTLPQAINQNLQMAEQNLVESPVALQFSDTSATRINSIEHHLQIAYQATIQNLETELRLKDNVISQLRQQAEDLQMLIKLMEQSKKF